MNNPNRIVAIPATRSEIINVAFQVFTIAVVGIFSVLTLVTIAAQIV